jgi:hypothetical protein
VLWQDDQCVRVRTWTSRGSGGSNQRGWKTSAGMVGCELRRLPTNHTLGGSQRRTVPFTSRVPFGMRRRAEPRFSRHRDAFCLAPRRVAPGWRSNCSTAARWRGTCRNRALGLVWLSVPEALRWQLQQRVERLQATGLANERLMMRKFAQFPEGQHRREHRSGSPRMQRDERGTSSHVVCSAMSEGDSSAAAAADVRGKR